MSRTEPHPSGAGQLVGVPARLAVIGSGVAGLTAAYVAAKSAHVTLFEADDRLGGHADTHQVGELAIDTGFIVHNERTYPTLLRIFAELGIQTQDSEMSMSVHDPATGVQYAGALGLGGLFPTARSMRDPEQLRTLAQVPRFHRLARRHLERAQERRDAGRPAAAADLTLRDFLTPYGFTPGFGRHFAEPLVAAVWSCEPDRALDYPATYLFTFLQHHGMLGIFGSPTWKTVVGGSRRYVEAVAATLAQVRVATPVLAVREVPDGVEVRTAQGGERFDAVVIATHPDQALGMLAEPSRAQREVLGVIGYSRNQARLHTDTSLLPPAERARASWNFLRPIPDQDASSPAESSSGGNAVTVTYDLTRLMRLPTKTRYLVTLGGSGLIDPAQVIDTMDYAHPLYTPESVAAQARLGEIETPRIAFAGAYHGWGFHEDGALSGRRAVERLGFTWPAGDGVPPTPRIYRTTVRHVRRQPMLRRFSHRSTMWLVDLDQLPDHGPWARFEARDHLGDPTLSIKQNVLAFLAAQGVAQPPARVLMAAHPRAWGYCFNPISVFWCWSALGELVAVVVEVHNTYGDREAYLVHPDANGRARVDKSMYVSPFHGVSGSYELAVPVPGERLRVAVTLHSDEGSGEQVFSASLEGADPVAADARAVRRSCLGALSGSLLIRAHGIALWARGLPIRPRPAHRARTGVWPERNPRDDEHAHAGAVVPIRTSRADQNKQYRSEQSGAGSRSGEERGELR